MVNVKDAVKSAAQFIKDMFDDARDVRLEEVEYNNHSGEWDVVISYIVQSTLGSLTSPNKGPDRIWKTIRVDSNNGEPLSLKSYQM